MNTGESLNQSPPMSSRGPPFFKSAHNDNNRPHTTTNYQPNNNNNYSPERGNTQPNSTPAPAPAPKNTHSTASPSNERHVQDDISHPLHSAHTGPTPLSQPLTTLDRSLDSHDDQGTTRKDFREGKKAHFLIGSAQLKGSLGLKRTKEAQGPRLLDTHPHTFNSSSLRNSLTQKKKERQEETSPQSKDDHPTEGPSKATITSRMAIGNPTPTMAPSSMSIPSSSSATPTTVKSDFSPRNTQSNKRLPSPIFCKSREENFECLADGSESFFDSTNESSFTSLQNFRESELSGFSGNGLAFSRNSQLRASLRSSPQNKGNTMGGHRRVGSFRNASGTKRSPVVPPISSSSACAAAQLYRSSSFHSSGRSSAGDVEEMYSDGSIEDEVNDLTQKYNRLEEKFTVLEGNQSNVDDRYNRSKQENIELSTKLFMLEEQMRDAEQRAEERLREEQRRSKELLSRLEREKELQISNYDFRLQSLQKDLDSAKSDGLRFKGDVEKERAERNHFNDKLIETEREVGNLRDENRKLLDEARVDRDALTLEKIGSQDALIDLKREFENLRKHQMNKSKIYVQHRESIDDLSELHSRLLELDEENKKLKNENRDLQELYDDLKAQLLNRGLEEGRQLLTMHHVGGMGNSLAAEFEAMSQDERTTVQGHSTIQPFKGRELNEMKSALKEQKDVNDQLKAYIDDILLIIVENYPQLLEVKNKCTLPQDKREP